MRLVIAGGAEPPAGLPFPQGPGKNLNANTWAIAMDA
jgi:hypothetical protein